ncbi:hypothetical protein [Ruminococcus flavefaciens]|uniref:Uncharacterized protein n=1 Tax=Ruminococcus flavefaciens TaxID=1265 RepID=A0A1M7HE25_RUMFL|nr:hypothetical protein [Ruminococcus flavefaciens]SHM26397.1 hypothetical protein SAMN04487860_102278 [Ruminococcus flavefaciens]
MISRVTAEFESPELAELAMKRVKESVDYVYSAKMIYNRISDKALKLSRGTSFSIIPTYYNTNTNFLTAVMESPASRDIIPEPARSRKTSACIICGSAAVDNVISVLNSMGALNIRFAQ